MTPERYKGMLLIQTDDKNWWYWVSPENPPYIGCMYRSKENCLKVIDNYLESIGRVDAD